MESLLDAEKRLMSKQLGLLTHKIKKAVEAQRAVPLRLPCLWISDLILRSVGGQFC